jgi:hypothetical protein
MSSSAGPEETTRHTRVPPAVLGARPIQDLLVADAAAPGLDGGLLGERASPLT